MAELDPATIERLRRAARDAARLAYCPYSRFHVGAAVLVGDAVFCGCNVENASYGLTICAERAAVFAAVVAGHLKLRAVAIACPDAASDADSALGAPCGACRQVLAEFGGDDLPIFFGADTMMTLGQLLPAAFRLERH